MVALLEIVQYNGGTVPAYTPVQLGCIDKCNDDNATKNPPSSSYYMQVATTTKSGQQQAVSGSLVAAGTLVLELNSTVPQQHSLLTTDSRRLYSWVVVLFIN